MFVFFRKKIPFDVYCVILILAVLLFFATLEYIPIIEINQASSANALEPVYTGDYFLPSDPAVSKFENWHNPPNIDIPANSKIAEGEKVNVEWEQIVPHGSLSEQSFLDYQKTVFQKIADVFNPDILALSYHEMFVSGWDSSDAGRTPGELLASHMQKLYPLIRSAMPTVPIATFGDDFDPNFFRYPEYILPLGKTYSGAHLGLSKDTIVFNWNYGSRESIDWWNNINQPEMININPMWDKMTARQREQWIAYAAKYPNWAGVLFGAWDNDLTLLPDIMKIADKHNAKNKWCLIKSSLGLGQESTNFINNILPELITKMKGAGVDTVIFFEEDFMFFPEKWDSAYRSNAVAMRDLIHNAGMKFGTFADGPYATINAYTSEAFPARSKFVRRGNQLVPILEDNPFEIQNTSFDQSCDNWGGWWCGWVIGPNTGDKPSAPRYKPLYATQISNGFTLSVPEDYKEEINIGQSNIKVLPFFRTGRINFEMKIDGPLPKQMSVLGTISSIEQITKDLSPYQGKWADVVSPFNTLDRSSTWFGIRFPSAPGAQISIRNLQILPIGLLNLSPKPSSPFHIFASDGTEYKSIKWGKKQVMQFRADNQ